MYRQLFGFSKNPFRQTPDPAYLFLGQHHEEAMAHLTYVLMNGEGFSVLTGEPGVGKTTICRSYLQKLESDIQAAYIHDIAGTSPLKLLRRINAAFQISANSNNIKDLTDALNAFLIRKNREGYKVVLFIDDAHALSSDVLEQVRLLSNLETTRHKLIQIVLIGRPELSDRLASHELRQIGQRVSVNWHIDPLSYEETLAYVQHRISVSSSGPPVRFDQSAVRPLHRFTDGIPRRINSACDRMLKEAYDRRERIIDDKIAKSALEKLVERRTNRPAGWNHRPLLLGGTACLLLIAIVVGAYVLFNTSAETPAIAAVVTKSIGPVPEMPPQAPSDPPATADPEDVLPADSPAIQEPIDAPPDEHPTVAEPADDIVPVAIPADIQVQTPVTTEIEEIPEPVATETRIASPGGTLPTRLTHSVQVGAFLDEANALKRMESLKKSGYIPRIVSVSGPGGLTYHTVRIGDYPSFEMARQQAEAFTASESTPSAVRPYGAY